MYAIAKYKNCGSASSFYTLKNSKRGFKTFETQEAAIVSHYNQTKLAEHDLAPRVYSEVGRVRVRGELSDWGYITEIATTIGCGGNDCSCCDRDELEEMWSEEIDNLVSDIEDIGFYFGDCHSGNVGFVRRNGRGVMVCIDTGDESVSSDDGPCFCLVCKKGGNCRE
jgi:hypothetical protein